MDQTQQLGQTGQPPQGFPQGGGGQFAGGPPGGRIPGGRALMFLGPYGGLVAFGLLAVTYIVLAISFWRFLKKAGLTPGLALLMLLPVVNLFVALWAAFTEWPVLKEIDKLKALVATQAAAAAGASGASREPSVSVSDLASTAEASVPSAPAAT